MSFKKNMMVVIASFGIVGAAFGLAARDASFGLADEPAPAAEESDKAAVEAPAPLEGYENCGFDDCNRNGVDDRCDVDCSNSGIFCQGGFPANAMCNSGWHPSCGTSVDCNDNGTPDECEGVECCSDGDCGPWQCCGQITPNTCNFCIE